MSDEQISPFIPGVRVAITDGMDNWREGIVKKVYKTGRFTLKGSNQQWRPNSPQHYHPYWRANQTGDQGWSRRSWLRLWDEAVDAEIKELLAAQARKKPCLSG